MRLGLVPGLYDCVEQKREEAEGTAEGEEAAAVSEEDAAARGDGWARQVSRVTL